jgi:hypothetical protein
VAILLTTMGEALVAQGQFEAASKAFGEALEVWKGLEPGTEMLRTRAGLAKAALASNEGGQAEAARRHVDAILEYLRSHPERAGEPAAIDAAARAARILGALGDPRAGEVTAGAERALEERAARIAEPEMRRSFLENVSAHRALRQELEGATGANVQ